MSLIDLFEHYWAIYVQAEVEGMRLDMLGFDHELGMGRLGSLWGLDWQKL